MKVIKVISENRLFSEIKPNSSFNFHSINSIIDIVMKVSFISRGIRLWYESPIKPKMGLVFKNRPKNGLPFISFSGLCKSWNLER